MEKAAASPSMPQRHYVEVEEHRLGHGLVLGRNPERESVSCFGTLGDLLSQSLSFSPFLLVLLTSTAGRRLK